MVQGSETWFWQHFAHKLGVSSEQILQPW